MKPLGSTDLKRLHREWRRRTPRRLALALEDVQSPFNVGAIVRTAAAYRVETLWLVGTTPDLAEPKVGRTAMGCERFLAWERTRSSGEAIEEARGDGYRIIGLELASLAHPLHELQLSSDTCLVIGNEDRGLRAATLALCDEVGYLPQLGRVGSLNVAAATAIACYEARRQVWAADSHGPTT